MTSDDVMRSIFEEAKTIAVVGASHDSERAGCYIPAYLKKHGYRIIGVNPNLDRFLGEPAYPTLSDVPEPIDVVEVFRRSEYTPEVAREAVAVGAKALWLQLGIINDEARRIADEGGLVFVQDECMGPQHRRLIGASTTP